MPTTSADHILVYATAGFDSLLQLLRTFKDETFIVYGYHKDLTEANIQFRSFSDIGFLQDLASCKAVIATAGFTLITEALYFRKPYLALPMQGQFEQVLNATMLQRQGYGRACFDLSKQEISAFLAKLSDYNVKLSEYPHEGNDKITAFLDELLENQQEKLRQYRHN